ncbi:hypothetical protein C5S32_01250 [ANME-1 cluster archaeon GoMg1]|nr:hypothetical protein [ANME-1 cluster archaeon GoMg1]
MIDIFCKSRTHRTDAPQFRSCLTIQNLNKKGQIRLYIKNNQSNSENVLLWDKPFIVGVAWSGLSPKNGILYIGSEWMLRNPFRVRSS